MVATTSRCVWVLLSYRVPREPSTPRIAVWRKLKRLGGAQVGDGLVALPADARTQEQLEWVAEEILEAGGSASLWRAELVSLAQERALIQQMAQARGREYTAIAERAGAGLASDGPTGLRLLRSLRRELRQVQRRDFFPPSDRDLARAQVRVLADAVLARAEAVPEVVS